MVFSFPITDVARETLGLTMNEACGTLRCQTLEASFHSFLDSGMVAEKSANPKFKKKFTNIFQNA